MAIVYFDQRVWIDLLKAREGITQYSQYKDIYNKVVETADSKEHIYPISSCHVIETQKRTDYQSRYDLLRFILETSKLNSILPHSQIINLEIRNAILESLDVEIRNTILDYLNIERINLKNKVIGKGLDHCFGEAGYIFKGIHDINTLIEIFNSEGRKNVVEKTYKSEKELVQFLEDVKEKILKEPDKQQRKNLAEAYQFTRYSKGITEELIELTVFEDDIKHIYSNRETYRNFWKQAPSTYIFVMLNIVRNLNKSRKIKLNDLYDLQCVSTASAYCDIVVTEREWANILNRENIAELYNTKIIYKIKDLENLI